MKEENGSNNGESFLFLPLDFTDSEPCIVLTLLVQGWLAGV
jgi:hypothetical protein